MSQLRKLVLTVLLFSVPTAAIAEKKRVAVLRFSGKNAAKFRKQVARAIQDRFRIVAASDYYEAAESKDATSINRDNLKQVAPYAGVDGVIVGRVKRKRGKYRVTIVLRSGATGKIIKKVRVKSRSTSLKKRTLRLIASKLGRSARKLRTVEEKEEDAPVKQIKDDDDPFSADSRKPEDEKDDDEDVDDDDDPLTKRRSKRDDDKPKGPHNPRNYRALVLAGSRGMVRQLGYSTAEGLPNPPSNYNSGLMVDATVDLEVFPFAFVDSNSLLSGVGLIFGYDQTFRAQTEVVFDENGMQQSSKVPTSHNGFKVGAAFRYNFKKPISLRVQAVYRKETFSFNRSNIPSNVVVDLPNVSYSSLEPGVGFVYDATPNTSVGLDASAMLIMGAGSIQQTTEFGGGTVTGIDAGAYFEYRIAGMIPLRIGGGMTFIGYDFDGSGEKTKNRDGDMSTIDVGGAYDRQIFGYLSLGYRY